MRTALRRSSLMKARSCASTARYRRAPLEAEIKNGAVLVRYPRRRDIAPAGELAGLPARNSPKPYPPRDPSGLEAGIYPAKITETRRGLFISDTEVYFA